jgi:phytoene dehydrogenase-like protein
VEHKSGVRQYADHIISASDGYTAIYGLLDGRYTSPRIKKLYNDLLNKPGILYPGVVSAFVGIQGDFNTDEAHSTTYLLPAEEGAELPGALQNSLVVQLRSRYSDDFAPCGKSVVHCTYFSDFVYWKTLRSSNRRKYWAEKCKVAALVRSFLERRYPGIGERIELVDVASPVTTKRYTGNFNGSILAWQAFSDADDLVTNLINKDRMRLPGLRGFSMAGQWVGMGGLIRAASSGRFVTQFLCEELGLKFKAWESSGHGTWHRDKLGHLPQLDKRPVEQTTVGWTPIGP